MRFSIIAIHFLYRLRVRIYRKQMNELLLSTALKDTISNKFLVLMTSMEEAATAGARIQQDLKTQTGLLSFYVAGTPLARNTLLDEEILPNECRYR